MELNGYQEDYERAARLTLLDQRIHSVSYGLIHSSDTPFSNKLYQYESKFGMVHGISASVYFETVNGRFCITSLPWTAWSGISAILVSAVAASDLAYPYENLYPVNGDPLWQTIIGLTIVRIAFHWKSVFVVQKNETLVYPETLELQLYGGQMLYFSAGKFMKLHDARFVNYGRGIILTDKTTLAQQLEMIK